jgi:hypothetical protein
LQVPHLQHPHAPDTHWQVSAGQAQHEHLPQSAVDTSDFPLFAAIFVFVFFMIIIPRY